MSDTIALKNKEDFLNIIQVKKLYKNLLYKRLNFDIF